MTQYTPKVVPMAHQAKALSLSYSKPFFGYTMEQGTGKSKTLCDDAAIHFLEGKIDTLLITAPNGVQRAWVKDHIPLNLADTVPIRSAVYYPRPTKRQQQEMDHVLHPSYTGLRIITLNYEAFGSKLTQAWVKNLLAKFKVMWALDESHRIKTWESVRTSVITKLAAGSVMRRILTGTPATQGPTDLYPQLYFLSPTILDQPSYIAFKSFYCVLERDDSRVMSTIKQRIAVKHNLVPRHGDTVEQLDMKEKRLARMMPKVIAKNPDGTPKVKNLDHLQKLMEPHIFRCLKSECLDLPPKVFITRYVKMHTEQRRIYDQLRVDFFTQYNAQIMTAPAVMTRFMRLQQITGGFFVPEGNTIPQPIGSENPKLLELLEIIEDYPGKFVIWARFKAELNMIADTLQATFGSASVARYWGEASAAEKDAARQAYINDPDCRFFVSQVQSGGTGTDGLQFVTQTMIFYSNDFSLLNRLQAEDRGHRTGMRHSLTIIDIESDGQIDNTIITALRNKKELADSINGDIVDVLAFV